MPDEATSLFGEEERLLLRTEEVSRSKEMSACPALAEEYRALAESFGKLLRQTKKIVRISDRLQQQLNQRSGEVEEERRKADATLEALISIGRSLSQEKDQDALLKRILLLSKRITGADAGSIFTVDTMDSGEKMLVFRCSDTTSKELPYTLKTMPLDTHSIAGYVAINGRVLNMPDVYAMADGSPVSFNPSFDRTYGYRTKSMLVVPMRNHWGEIIGVVQLINCKEARSGLSNDETYHIMLATPEDFERKVVAFQPRYENLMEAVASQAAIALENNRMIRQIQMQFEQFAQASVAAIESHDPATSGHSFRVARLSVNTARILHEQKTGPFAAASFSETERRELEMASLLHDFGKIYIDPAVFVKGKKLYPKDFAFLMLRLEYIYRTLAVAGLPGNLATDSNAASQDVKARLDLLVEFFELVTALNEPTVLDQDPMAAIRRICDHQEELKCNDRKGQRVPLLTDEEIESLQIRRGTLNARERAVIESHVEHSYAFARKIPWPTEFRNIPDIIRKHHERLDGSGYPDHVAGRDNIPLQSRIMAIADVFDALSAADRPYKKAVPLPRCFEILREEARRNLLDPELVELFICQEAYKVSQ